MAKLTFSGKKFSYPERITNAMVIGAAEIELNSDPAWWMNREALLKLMSLILDGPHDEIDWMEQESIDCIKAYKGFFGYVGKKVSESED